MLAERIVQAMDHAGLKPADLARATGRSTAAVAQWMHGPTKGLRADTAIAVARACSVSLQWLVHGPPNTMVAAPRPTQGFVAAYLDLSIVADALEALQAANEESPNLTREQRAHLFAELYSEALTRASEQSSRALVE